MRILITGGGAREHALAWKCIQSPLVRRVWCAPGNGGTAGVSRNLSLQPDDVAGLVRFARKEAVDLVVLGPEASVAAGLGDALRDAGIAAFGPGRGAGRIETSKAFAKELMVSAGIPTAGHAVFTDPAPARAWAAGRDGRVVVKADGLALGKGVVVCDGVEEANAAIDSMLVRRAFGRAGATVVLEDRLEGPEVSLMAITDGTRVLPLPPARDYKRAGEGDTGPNTGGMGAFSPPPDAGPDLVDEAVRTVLEPAVRALAARGDEYRGVIYAGLMLTPTGLRTLEFNARFGDPETQVVLPRIDGDLPSLMLAAARGDLSTAAVPAWSDRPCVGVVVASAGYPGSYEVGMPIDGLAAMPPGALLFHAGTRFVSGQGLVTSGGRVMTAVASGDTADAARRLALEAAARVRFAGAFHRTDIAQEAAVA